MAGRMAQIKYGVIDQDQPYEMLDFTRAFFACDLYGSNFAKTEV